MKERGTEKDLRYGIWDMGMPDQRQAFNCDYNIPNSLVCFHPPGRKGTNLGREAADKSEISYIEPSLLHQYRILNKIDPFMSHDQRIFNEVETIEGASRSNGRVSSMTQGLIGSEILRIAADIRTLVGEGKEICNLTVGDFSPKEFRIPAFLEAGIQEALNKGETNYPPSDGILALRTAVRDFYQARLGLRYETESILIAGGSRPGIYGTYRTLVDPGDIVVYPVPSWNNNHYCHIVGARERPVICGEAEAFLPNRTLLKDALRGARLLALNSPLNPTGTVFSENALTEVCDLVLEENRRRGKGGRPLYLMFDQVYWMLTFGSTRHVNPVSLRPELREYTILVDGMSKAFAATGVRVGWVVGPKDIMAKMSNLLGHVGAWAPRAEQVAAAKLLNAPDQITAYHSQMRTGVEERLTELYKGMSLLRSEGFPVNAIVPMGAIYLSARFHLNGKQTSSGSMLQTNEEIRQYLLQQAQVAVVPFQAFGSTEEDGWFRLSVGAVSMDEIRAMFPRLRSALSRLRS
jgi:aspartate aminotransferase